MRAATSSDAFREQIASGRAQTQRVRILECFRKSAVPLTRRQAAQLTGIPINAVTGRVATLMESGMLRKAYEDKDQGTGTRAEFLEPVTPAPVQRRFEFR